MGRMRVRSGSGVGAQRSRAKGGAKALIYRDTYLSWRGLGHRVDRRTDEFASMGVRPGDLVGLMLGHVPDPRL